MTTAFETDRIDTSWEECVAILDDLPSMPLAERVDAIERLLRSSSAGIREQALRVGAVVLPESTLVDYLRADADAILRNAGLEILKARGKRSFNVAVDLLADDDPDVVLQAVLVLDHLRDPRAVEPLRTLLAHEDINVVQATIVALGHLGGAQTVDDLLPFLAGDEWLQIGTVQALGDLRSTAAIGPLRDRLTDLMTGPLAAEALAQVGGARAFEALAEHWLRFHDDLDPETYLGLLAHVLSGLPDFPADVEGLRGALADRLRDPYHAVRVCAARCLLALGPGSEDSEALSVLAEVHKNASVLPGCLAHRQDLVGSLIEKAGYLRAWGLLLAARYPAAADGEALAGALRKELRPISIAPVLGVLKNRRDPAISQALLDLFLRLDAESRAALEPALGAHREALLALLDQRDEIPNEDRIILAATLGQADNDLAPKILELPAEGRIAVLTQLAGHKELALRMPWAEWLNADPARYLPLASFVAASSELREILPLLRDHLRSAPSIEAVRAVGELRDRKSVPILLEHLDDPPSLLQPVMLESLGRIGGPEARQALTAVAKSAEPQRSRLAYRALAECATEEDEPLFRDAVSHHDWYVRLASATVLGRFPRPENREALARLSADASSIVSERALTSIEE